VVSTAEIFLNGTAGGHPVFLRLVWYVERSVRTWSSALFMVGEERIPLIDEKNSLLLEIAN
jgi:hypothetical protein